MMQLTQRQLQITLFMGTIENAQTLVNILKPMNCWDTALLKLSEAGLKIIFGYNTSLRAVVYLKRENGIFKKYHFNPLIYQSQINEAEEGALIGINFKILLEHFNMFMDVEGALTILLKSVNTPLIVIQTQQQDSLITECSIATVNKLSIDVSTIFVNNINNQINFNGPDFYNFLQDFFRAATIGERVEVCIQENEPQFCIKTLGTNDNKMTFGVNKESDIVSLFKFGKDFHYAYQLASIKFILKSLALASVVTLISNEQGLLNFQLITDGDSSEQQSYIEFFISPIIFDTT